MPRKKTTKAALAVVSAMPIISNDIIGQLATVPSSAMSV